MAGRCVLTNFVTSTILAYVMQGTILPARIHNALDKINRNFIWGSTDERRKIHLVGWNNFMLFNGGMLDPFLPSRGIRQRDPLSPYIFILCMEMLNFFIDDKCSNNLWDPLKVACGGPAFSHLCYADDLVLFAKVDLKNRQSIKKVLESFCDLSSLKVNLSKSKILFSPNVSQLSGDSICETIGFQATSNLGKVFRVSPQTAWLHGA